MSEHKKELEEERAARKAKYTPEERMAICAVAGHVLRDSILEPRSDKCLWCDEPVKPFKKGNRTT